MSKIKADTSKYHVFIHGPSNKYVIIERQPDTLFTKLLVIYDYQFNKISDNQLVDVQFLDFDKKNNSYSLIDDSYKTIKVNELSDLPARVKFAFKIRKIFGL